MPPNVSNSDIGMAPKNACFPAILAVQALELAPRAVGLSNSYHTNRLRAIGDRCCFRRCMPPGRRAPAGWSSPRGLLFLRRFLRVLDPRARHGDGHLYEL